LTYLWFEFSLVAVSSRGLGIWSFCGKPFFRNNGGKRRKYCDSLSRNNAKTNVTPEGASPKTDKRFAFLKIVMLVIEVAASPSCCLTEKRRPLWTALCWKHTAISA
jgi:hypothetical protein